MPPKSTPKADKLKPKNLNPNKKDELTALPNSLTLADGSAISQVNAAGDTLLYTVTSSMVDWPVEQVTIATLTTNFGQMDIAFLIPGEPEYYIAEFKLIKVRDETNTVIERYIDINGEHLEFNLFDRVLGNIRRVLENAGIPYSKSIGSWSFNPTVNVPQYYNALVAYLEGLRDRGVAHSDLLSQEVAMTQTDQ